MGIFNFFKKKKQEKKGIIKISFKDIEEYIKNRKQEIENNQKEPKDKIKESLFELLQELEQGKILLEKIDLEEEKAPERAKLIVMENLLKFNYYLEKLISSLKEVGYGSLETIINKINLIFCEFEERSLNSFEKSTLLIGKELEKIRENIIKFYKIFNNIIKENEQLIKEDKTILIIEEKIRKFNEIEKNKIENEKIIKEVEEKIKNFEEKIQILEKEIEEKKKGLEYIKQIKTVQEIEELRRKLITKLQELKELINFKALTKAYHSIDNKMKLIKEYKENFKETFEKYNYEKLEELINIKEINQELIKEKIKDIEKIKQIINKIKIERDITEELIKSIIDMKRKIDDFNFEKSGKQKRDKKLREDREKIKEGIIMEFMKINVFMND